LAPIAAETMPGERVMARKSLPAEALLDLRRRLSAFPARSHARRAVMLNTKKHPLGDQLQALFQANDKVRAYLCAHEHLWNCSRLEKAPQVWQVIVGNAGSKLNSKWNPPGGTFFGFSQINVYVSGKVGLVNYQRPTPKPPQKYFEGAPVPPASAQPQPEVILYPLGR
jgi:hypothetical protein